MLSLRQVSLSTAVAITGIGMAFSHGNSDKSLLEPRRLSILNTEIQSSAIPALFTRMSSRP